MKSCLLFIVVYCFATTSVAQEKPNFSGDWVLVDPAVASINIAAEMSVSLRLSGAFIYPDEFVVVERRFGENARVERFMVRVIRDAVLPENTSWATWMGSIMVIQISRLPPGSMLRKEVWSLNSDGVLRISITDRPKERDPQEVEALYRRSAK